MSDCSDRQQQAFPLPHILRPGQVLETQAVAEDAIIAVRTERRLVLPPPHDRPDAVLADGAPNIDGRIHAEYRRTIERTVSRSVPLRGRVALAAIGFIVRGPSRSRRKHLGLKSR